MHTALVVIWLLDVPGFEGGWFQPIGRCGQTLTQHSWDGMGNGLGFQAPSAAGAVTQLGALLR